MSDECSVTFIPGRSSQLSFDSKTVDEYILGPTLGQGSCAIVKLGTHSKTGEQVAVKIVRPSTMQKQKEVLREVEALRVLRSHPHIVKLVKVIKENGFVCLILELGKGGELFNYILENGRMSETQARKMFRQILSGVQFMHSHLVVHRDLKPENILLDKNGDAKITDFGLSNFLKPNNLFSTFCGSPIYTSPEIVLHRKYNGVLADVWSLGVILFVVVTGGMPWRLEHNKVQNMDALLSANFRLPDSLGLSEECKDLIRSMLTAESRDRASIETIVQHPWVNKGYDAPPDAFLPKQPLVNLTDINYDLVEQLSQLSMDPTKACSDIQERPHSPALTAYRCLLNKHARAQRVAENVTISDIADVAPASPQRTRARSDPTAERMKMEKTRLQRLKEEDGARSENGGVEIATSDKAEKERIREKIKRWKNLHKSHAEHVSPSKNSAIVNQSSHINADSSPAASEQTHDKTRTERFKNFFTYFRRSHAGEPSGVVHHSNKDASSTKVPLKLDSSPGHVRRSPVALRHSPRVARR